MKHLYGGLAASAAGLLLTAGLASPAAAQALPTCAVVVTDVAVAEGDAGSIDLAFTITALAGVADGCDGAGVDYTFAPGTAAAGTDYSAADGTASFGPGVSQTRNLTASIIGDTAVEPDEAFSINLAPSTGSPTVADPSGVGAIVNDDNIGAGGAATIDPSSGPTGTDITVTGTECSQPTGSAVLVAIGDSSASEVAEDLDNPVTGGTFTAQLTVPAGSDPDGTFAVSATCGTGNRTDRYDNVPFDVTGQLVTGGNGYRMVAGDGGIFTFGAREFHGSTGDMTLNKPIVGGATDVSDYDGYWIVASDGGVFTFNAEFFGSLGGTPLSSPAVEIEPTPSGKGYFIVLANGRVYPFGDARSAGDMSTRALNKPIIGMSVTPTGGGYWLVAEDGGIFNFGDADFFGSMGDQKLNAPVIDLAPAVDNKGYYLLGADGGVFTFGSAAFRGSTGDMTLNAPVVAMLVNPAGSGYWLAAADGGIFTFGAGVEFLGSMGATKLNSPVLDLIN